MSERAPRLAVKVADIVEVAPLVKQFRFEAADGARLPAFAGGAHIVVDMRDGDNLRRNSYSLTSPPFDTSHYTIGVRRSETGRGGSRFLHDIVRIGMVLRVGLPVNLFPIEQRARKHLFIAGGIGVTPFVAMAAQLRSGHQTFDLHYVARGRAAYADALVADHGSRVRLYGSDRGERIDLDRLLGHQPLGTHLYVCGPPGMIEAVLGSARALGWPEQTLHHERFAAPAVGDPYDVTLARSAVTLRVGGHQSMLEAIEAAGVDAPYLCRGGACGQCETDVVSCDGRLLHYDHFLTEAEHASGDKVMPCVSRFEGKSLVLDL